MSATFNFTEIIPSRISFKNLNHIIQKIHFEEHFAVYTNKNVETNKN